jgi:hypothetical protein
MEGDHQRERRGPFIGCLIVALIVGYVLSFGPFVWLAERRYVNQNLGVIYIPLGFIRMYCPPFKAALDRYTDLWGG